MSYRMLKILMVASAALASASIANAHAIKKSAAQNYYNGGTPSDFNMGVERDIHGAPHGSMDNPSPHDYTNKSNGGSSAFASERESLRTSSPNNLPGGSEGYERLLKTY